MIGRDRKPKADAVRSARFREIAREILWKDRDHRKYGRAVDTGGAIARALERAYREGFAAAFGTESESDAMTLAAAPPGVVEWGLIPPRPRTAFWSICLYVLGREGGRSEGFLVPARTPRGTAGWQISWSRGLHDRVIAQPQSGLWCASGCWPSAQKRCRDSTSPIAVAPRGSIFLPSAASSRTTPLAWGWAEPERTTGGRDTLLVMAVARAGNSRAAKTRCPRSPAGARRRCRAKARARCCTSSRTRDGWWN